MVEAQDHVCWLKHVKKNKHQGLHEESVDLLIPIPMNNLKKSFHLRRYFAVAQPTNRSCSFSYGIIALYGLKQYTNAHKHSLFDNVRG